MDLSYIYTITLEVCRKDGTWHTPEPTFTTECSNEYFNKYLICIQRPQYITLREEDLSLTVNPMSEGTSTTRQETVGGAIKLDAKTKHVNNTETELDEKIVVGCEEEKNLKAKEDRLEKEFKAKEERLEKEFKAKEDRLEKEFKAKEERLQKEFNTKEERLEKEFRGKEERLEREKVEDRKNGWACLHDVDTDPRRRPRVDVAWGPKRYSARGRRK